MVSISTLLWRSKPSPATKVSPEFETAFVPTGDYSPFSVPIRLFTVKKPASYLPEARIGSGLTATSEIPDSVGICFSRVAAQEAHFGKLISIRQFSGAIVSPLAVRPPRPYTAPRATRRFRFRIVNRETELPIAQSAQSVLFLAGRRDLLLSTHPL